MYMNDIQDVAERVGREARARHWQPRVLPMDAYDVRLLPEESEVILVASTTGQVLTPKPHPLNVSARPVPRAVNVGRAPVWNTIPHLYRVRCPANVS